MINILRRLEENFLMKKVSIHYFLKISYILIRFGTRATANWFISKHFEFFAIFIHGYAAAFMPPFEFFVQHLFVEEISVNLF